MYVNLQKDYPKYDTKMVIDDTVYDIKKCKNSIDLWQR